MTDTTNNQINQQLLTACKQALAAMEAALECDDPQARTQPEWEAEPLSSLRLIIAEAEKATPPKTELCIPWTLHFDRDGTEDYGIICDAEGNDLVVSHLPGTKMPRWKDREFGEGCFWLPENEGDPVPYLVKVMRLMTAAPRMYAVLEACEKTMKHFQDWLCYVDEFLHHQDERKHKEVDDVLQEARKALAEANGEEPKLAD